MTRACIAPLLMSITLLLPGCDKVTNLLGGEDKPTDENEKDGDEVEAGAGAKPAADPVAKADAPAKPVEGAPDTKTEAAPVAEPVVAAADPAEPAAVPVAEPVAPPTEAAIAEAAAPPCIVGHWEATDYLAQINRALRSDPQLKSMTYKSKSGTIGYVIEAATDGKAVIKAKASDLSYQYAGKVQGIEVSLGLTMTGEITSTYELADPSRIIVAKPTENTMRVKAKVKLKGLGSARDSSKVKHEFDGDFPYECTDTELTVWSNGKDDRPLKFKRLEA